MLDKIKLSLGDIEILTYQAGDYEPLREAAHDPDIWRFQDKKLHQQKEFDRWLTKALDQVASGTRQLLVVKQSNAIIGSTSFYDINKNNLQAMLGYTWLSKSCWGNGVNQKIKYLLLHYGFEQLKLERISFSVDVTNLPARKALEKLGIPFEKIIHEHFLKSNGEYRDSAIYAASSTDWSSIERKICTICP